LKPWLMKSYDWFAKFVFQNVLININNLDLFRLWKMNSLSIHFQFAKGCERQVQVRWRSVEGQMQVRWGSGRSEWGHNQVNLKTLDKTKGYYWVDRKDSSLSLNLKICDIVKLRFSSRLDEGQKGQSQVWVIWT